MRSICDGPIIGHNADKGPGDTCQQRNIARPVRSHLQTATSWCASSWSREMGNVDSVL